MKTEFRRPAWLFVAAALPLTLIAVLFGYRSWKHHRQERASASLSAPAHKAASGALHVASQPTKTARGIGTYLDVIRAAYPDFPATQPLAAPLELSQAAHLRITDPIYLGGLGRIEMWITRAGAPPIESVLDDAANEAKDLDTHVLNERVAFVHWMPSDTGGWPPYLVCHTSTGGYELISAARGRQPLPASHRYRWDCALSWNEKIVVPTEHGVSVFHFVPRITESYHDLAPASLANNADSTYSQTRFLLDATGLLAWLPWETGKVGGRGAAHYTEPLADETTGNKIPPTWTDLTPDHGWPAKILHLVPLLDGAVLMLAVNDQGAVQLQFNTLEHALVKEGEIAALVDQLSDTDQAIRDAAYGKLSQYGSGIWPLLEKLLPDQGPEAQQRLRQLLKQRVAPTLNGMALLGSKTLTLASRLSDGGTVFFAPAGVSVPNPDDPDAGPRFRVPAWISIRPGRPIELLPEALTADLTPGQSKLYVNGNDWIVSNDARGPRRFVGNGFITVLRKSEHAYSDFVGVDRRGRWLFRKPASPAAPLPATSPADSDTLIIDPTLPDPTPRLPVWAINNADQVGWTRDGWPVIRKNSAYALHEHGWQLLDASETVFTRPEDAPAPVEAGAPTTAASTNPAAPPATTSPAAATTQPVESPLLTDRDGTRYFGGLTDLRLVRRRGPGETWILPAIANGEGPAWLVRTKDGRLFLFNQPGRILRLRPTPEASDPFKLEAIFTRRVPSAHHPTRIWLDPAGRIAMAWDNQLAIFFPDGYIPPPIAEIMLLNASGEMEE